MTLGPDDPTPQDGIPWCPPSPPGWQYVQATGDLLLNGQWVARGYSGRGEGKNSPNWQNVRSWGPIPCGAWTILGPPYDTDSHGPFVMRLEPATADTETFGRSGFLIHGDAIGAPGTASLGCVIMAREIRSAIWASGDRRLTVVASNSSQPAISQGA